MLVAVNILGYWRMLYSQLDNVSDINYNEYLNAGTTVVLIYLSNSCLIEKYYKGNQYKLLVL